MTSVALSSFLLCAPSPGSAQRLTKTQPEWLKQKTGEGWRKVQDGVLQRDLGEGRTETLTYGEEGRRALARRLEDRIRSLQQEHDAYPSPELAQAIVTLKGKLAEERWSAAPDPSVTGSATLPSCALSHVVEATADPLPASEAPGVTASAHAAFQNSCGTLGNIYAFAYVRATEASTMTTRTQEDGKNDGASLDSRATASLGGSLDCFAQAIAQVSIPSQGLHYETEDVNYSCPPPAATAQLPYLGKPFAVPGTIKAADFDTGGEGVAYHDTTPGNLHGVYRNTDVDVNGVSLFFPAAGEWLEYTVDVETAGAYTLVAQVSSRTPGGSFHVELVDGAQVVNVTGPVAVPLSTHDGHWLSAIKAGVKLPAGRLVLRVVVDQTFDWLYAFRFVVAQSPFGGTPKVLPGTFHAADFDEGGEQISFHDHTIGSQGGSTYRTGDVDHWNQDVVWWTSPGEWMEYTVDVAAAGIYTLGVRVGSDGGGGIFHVEVDGVDVTGPLTIPNTGSWAAFQTVTRPGVSLSAGRKVLRLVIDHDGGNFEAGTFSTISVLP